MSGGRPLVLTNPDLLPAPGKDDSLRTGTIPGRASPPAELFLAYSGVRDCLGAQTAPIRCGSGCSCWEYFSRRLDAIVRGECEHVFPVFLREFEAAVRSGILRATMETIPVDLALQLDMVMQLVQLRMDGTI